MLTRLVVLACEVGGRWTDDSQWLVRQLARSPLVGRKKGWQLPVAGNKARTNDVVAESSRLLFVAIDSSCRQASLCSSRSHLAQPSVIAAPSTLHLTLLPPSSTTRGMSSSQNVSSSKEYVRAMRDDRKMNASLSPRSDTERSERSSERFSGRHSDPGTGSL